MITESATGKHQSHTNTRIFRIYENHGDILLVGYEHRTYYRASGCFPNKKTAVSSNLSSAQCQAAVKIGICCHKEWLHLSIKEAIDAIDRMFAEEGN